jgi:hypothetical protein
MLRVRRSPFVVPAALAIGLALLTPAGAQTTTTTPGTAAKPTQVRDDGVGKPPVGAGMGTKAALENPKCNADAVAGWGVFSFVTTNGGPFCVAPAPKNNGGATSRGVTKKTIKVVVVLANDEQLALQTKQGSQSAKNEANGEVGTMENAIHDGWAPYAKFYEQWGRTVEFSFVTSTGGDEAAQRADVVKVKQERPFAVIDSTPDGLVVLQAALAQEKYVVFGYGTTVENTSGQAPYRWGQTDQQSGAINTAEWAGKQLVGRNAIYAGDESLTGRVRSFGAVYPDSVNIAGFAKSFGAYGGKLATPGLKYTSSGGILGDPTTAQEQAPTIISKLKDSGVTSVFLFTDIGMTSALTRAATREEYRPEWITTGFQFDDLSLLARNYDQEQWAHAFGLSNLFPSVVDAPISTTALSWYWGDSVATSSTLGGAMVSWLASGIHYAGPTLTAQNFQKGYFAVPARGGAASNVPIGFQNAYGKTAGLPYDEYMQLGTDFAPIWYDAETVGLSQVRPVEAQGVTWYVGGAKRYSSGQWPKKPFKFFDKSGAVYVFPSNPVPTTPPVPCTGCPSQGGTGTPAASSA